MPVQVKGSAVTARIRWVRELYGEAGFRALREALDPEMRALFEGRILPHEWVPFELFVAVSVELDRLYGRGDLELCRELGRYSARANLPTLYRIFYALGNPGFIVRRAARVWDIHYSSGRLEIVDTPHAPGRDAVAIRLVAFQTPHRAHCLAVLGWAEESVALSGGKDVRAAKTRCRLDGDPVCELVASWR